LRDTLRDTLRALPCAQMSLDVYHELLCPYPTPLLFQNGMATKAPYLMLHHFALLFAFTLGCYLVRWWPSCCCPFGALPADRQPLLTSSVPGACLLLDQDLAMVYGCWCMLCEFNSVFLHLVGRPGCSCDWFTLLSPWKASLHPLCKWFRGCAPPPPEGFAGNGWAQSTKLLRVQVGCPPAAACCLSLPCARPAPS
jgi:hypothetical protein